MLPTCSKSKFGRSPNIFLFYFLILNLFQSTMPLSTNTKSFQIFIKFQKSIFSPKLKISKFSNSNHIPFHSNSIPFFPFLSKSKFLYQHNLSPRNFLSQSTTIFEKILKIFNRLITNHLSISIFKIRLQSYQLLILTFKL